MRISDWSSDVCSSDLAAMTEWRRDFHRHPELGFQETRTSRLIAERLEAFGIEVHAGVGGTGVVGVLRRGSSNRAVGLRDRKSVVSGKSVSVRVDIGGRRIIKNKKNNLNTTKTA